ncbi:MAG: tetratricopeptide repeat protein [Armatimonadia bacterium]
MAYRRARLVLVVVLILTAGSVALSASTTVMEWGTQQAIAGGKWRLAHACALRWNRREPNNLVVQWLVWRISERVSDTQTEMKLRERFQERPKSNCRPVLEWAWDLASKHPESAYACQFAADAAYLAGEAKSGFEAAKRAVDLAPDDPYSYRVCGWLYFLIGDISQAVKEMMTATQIAPQSPVAWGDLGSLYLQREELAAAQEALLKSLAADPRYDVARLSLAEAYISSGDYAKAAQVSSQAIEGGRHAAMPYYWRAKAEQKQGEKDQAIRDLTAAIGYLPDLPTPYMWRARLYLDLRDADRALADLDRAATLDPERRKIYLYRGMAYHLAHRVGQSEADWGTFVKLSGSGAPGAHAELGAMWASWHEYDKAAAEYSEALNYAPDVRGFWALARVHEGRGDTGAAARAWADGLALAGAAGRTHMQRGIDRYEQGRFGDAMTDFTSAVRLEATTDAHYWRAMALTQLGRSKEAEADWPAGRALDHRSMADATFARGIAKYRCGDYTGAVADLSQVIGVWPAAKPYSYRCLAYQGLRQYEAMLSDSQHLVEQANDADAHLTRATAHYLLGSKKQALADTALAVERGSQDADILYRGFVIYRDLGHPREGKTVGASFLRIALSDDPRVHEVQEALRR